MIDSPPFKNEGYVRLGDLLVSLENGDAKWIPASGRNAHLPDAPSLGSARALELLGILAEFRGEPVPRRELARRLFPNDVRTPLDRDRLAELGRRKKTHIANFVKAVNAWLGEFHVEEGEVFGSVPPATHGCYKLVLRDDARVERLSFEDGLALLGKVAVHPSATHALEAPQPLSPFVSEWARDLDGGEAEMPSEDDVVVMEPSRIRLLYVPGGSFWMGDGEHGHAAERPVHLVRLSPYLMGECMVTVRDYERFLDEGTFASADDKRRCIPRYWKDADYKQRDQPVVGINYHMIERYLNWSGLQLPTEAQWEFAARGPRNYRYPWGNTWPVDNREVVPRYDPRKPVPPAAGAQYNKSWCGAINMVGVAWQWVSDWFAPYGSHDEWDPTGPPAPPPRGNAKRQDDVEEDYRVLRGGPDGSSADPRATERGANFLSWDARIDSFRAAASLDWRFLRSYFGIGCDIEAEARSALDKALLSIGRCSADEARRFLMGSESDPSGIPMRSDLFTDGQYTVFEPSGRLVVHRQPEFVANRRRFSEIPHGLDLHAAIVSMAHVAKVGTVRWLDNLCSDPQCDHGPDFQHPGRLRINCASYCYLPEFRWYVVAEVHYRVAEFLRSPRSTMIRWFSRAAWFVREDMR